MCCQMVTVAHVIPEALTEHPATQLRLHFKGCRYIQNNLRGFCASLVISVYAEHFDHPCLTLLLEPQCNMSTLLPCGFVGPAGDGVSNLCGSLRETATFKGVLSSRLWGRCVTASTRSPYTLNPPNRPP